MANDDEVRMEYLKCRIHRLRQDKHNLLARFKKLDEDEVLLTAVFTRNFPNEPLLRPAVTWDELSYEEKLTLHFLRKVGPRGRAAELSIVYMGVTGDVVTPDAFKMRLSTLKAKGAVVHDGYVWAIAPSFAEVARKRPESPHGEFPERMLRQIKLKSALTPARRLDRFQSDDE